MAASNDNSGKIYQSEAEVSDATLFNPKAGDQLQELLVILTELQLLKKSRKETTALKLPSFEKPIERVEGAENLREKWSFPIESAAIVPEVLTNNEEIPSQRQQNNSQEPDLSRTAAKVEKIYRPSEEELEQAVEQFKQLQQDRKSVV